MQERSITDLFFTFALRFVIFPHPSLTFRIFVVPPADNIRAVKKATFFSRIDPLPPPLRPPPSLLPCTWSSFYKGMTALLHPQRSEARFLIFFIINVLNVFCLMASCSQFAVTKIKMWAQSIKGQALKC